MKLAGGLLSAAFWGWLSGSALLVGAALGYWLKIPNRVAAAVMSFGSGVLISALSLDLMQDAYERGGLVPTGVGFLGGAAIYTAADWALSHRGARHRKRSGHGKQPTEREHGGSGLAIALGALLDGIPESIVVGLTILTEGTVSKVAVIAIFLSNLPEGLSSASGMKKARRSFGYIFGVWGAICLVSGFASMAGYAVFGSFSLSIISATTAVAAGAILSMIANTMIPEAFEEARNASGFIVVMGFLTAFVVSKLSVSG